MRPILPRFFSAAQSRLWIFASIMLGALLVYAPALKGQFLWDDEYLVGENPFFRSPIFALEVFRHYLFLDSLSVYYRPVQNLTYMVDYWVWNTNAFGYHLSNVCYHAFSAYLLYLLLRKLLPPLLDEGDRNSSASAVAALVALVWVVHPIHNAAVAYVSGRADSLASLAMLSAWLLYLQASALIGFRAGRVCLYLSAAGLCLLGLCSKETGGIWMALFVIHLFAFDSSRSRGQKLRTTTVLLVILGCYLVLRHLPPANAGAPRGLVSPIEVRVILMLRALGDYVSLIFYPANLHVDRIVVAPMAHKSVALWQQMIGYYYLSLIGALTILAFCYMCLRHLPGQRLRVFGATWFILGFLPISNLFPLNAQVAEHWIYMPSIGFFLFVAGCIVSMPIRTQKMVCGIILLATVGLGIRTAIRSNDWIDAETFYKKTIEAGGGTTRIHLNLALVYARRGQDALAEQVLRDAVKRFPGHATARINLGSHLAREGKTKEAEEYLKSDKTTADALATQYPTTWLAALSLAQMRHKEKQSDQALSILDEAIARSPGIWEMVQFKATVLKANGKLPAAIATVESYAQRYWWHYNSHLFLGRLLGMDNRLDAAVATLEQAGRLDIHAVEPFNLIAQVHLSRHRLEDACTAESRAIRRDPNQPSQYLFLATILDQLNRKEEAERARKKAEELWKSVGGSLKDEPTGGSDPKSTLLSPPVPLVVLK